MDDLNFHYDIYELAKSHLISYLLSLNKSSNMFFVIHFDVWGLVNVPSISKDIILWHLLMNALGWLRCMSLPF